MSAPVLRPAMLLVVAAGGAVGTAARQVLVLAVPDRLPLAVLGINVVGAALLGVLLEALLRRGPDEGRRRLLRLAAGTGFCGGFTTYSTLALGTAALLRDGAPALGIGSALGSVLLGALAAWGGAALGARTGPRR